SMKHARPAQGRRRRGLSGVKALSGGLNAHERHVLMIQEVEVCASGIASTADAGYDIVRKWIALLFRELTADLLANHGLQSRDKIRIGMRTDHRSDDVVCFRRMIDP